MLLAGVGTMGLVSYNLVELITEQTDDTIDAEVKGLAEQYRSGGIGELTRSVRQRSSEVGDSLYLLTRGDRTPLAGNLLVYPDAVLEREGRFSFTYSREGPFGPEPRDARARMFQLSGDYRLIVGRDVEEARGSQSVVIWGLAIATGIFVVLCLTFGVLIANHVFVRIDDINRTARDIMTGNLGLRVAKRGNDDEFDQLSDNLNEMLEQIERLMLGMKEVSDNIAHDLRTPLNRLRQKLEGTLIARDRDDTDRAALEGALTEADNLLQTFNALLAIAQVEAGTRKEQMNRLQVEPIVADLAELYDPVAEEKGIALSYRQGADATVWGNRELLSQAVANLIDNAIKYTPPGGAIEVTTRLRRLGQPLLEIWVSDSGPGIPPGQRGRVLNRFVRLEASRNTPGSGLGLSLVAAVARLHEGQIRFEDGLPQQGEDLPQEAGQAGLAAILSIKTIR